MRGIFQDCRESEGNIKFGEKVGELTGNLTFFYSGNTEVVSFQNASETSAKAPDCGSRRGGSFYSKSLTAKG